MMYGGHTSIATKLTATMIAVVVGVARLLMRLAVAVIGWLWRANARRTAKRSAPTRPAPAPAPAQVRRRTIRPAGHGPIPRDAYRGTYLCNELVQVMDRGTVIWARLAGIRIPPDGSEIAARVQRYISSRTLEHRTAIVHEDDGHGGAPAVTVWLWKDNINARLVIMGVAVATRDAFGLRYRELEAIARMGLSRVYAPDYAHYFGSRTP